MNFSNLRQIVELPETKVCSRNQLITKIAARRELLKLNGIADGDRVMIAHGGTADFFADLFAVWGVGASALCLNQSITQNEFDNLISFSKPAGVCFAADAKLVAPGHVKPIVTSDAVECSSASADMLSFPYPADKEALVLFTSGTTGDPKGVVHTFGSLLARLEMNLAHFDSGVLDKTLCVLPTHFGHGLIGNCLTPLVGGHSLFLNSSKGIMGALQLGALIDAHEITFMSSVPSYWKIALKGMPPKNANLKQINIGSAPLGGDLLSLVSDWSKCLILKNMYGITETANWISGSAGNADIDDGCVGLPWGGEVNVSTKDGYEKIGAGEICVKSDALMQGYLNRPNLTAEVLKNGYFHTGDKGEISADGIITLTGRLKSEINRAGMKISPEEIDLLLERHDDISEVCCFGLEDEISGEIVAVALVLNQGCELEDMALKKWCATYIRPECIPERIFRLDEIPKTDRGKINRMVVKKACLDG